MKTTRRGYELKLRLWLENNAKMKQMNRLSSMEKLRFRGERSFEMILYFNPLMQDFENCGIPRQKVDSFIGTYLPQIVVKDV